MDIGNPQLAMHSIRETCGVDDTTHCINLMKVRPALTYFILTGLLVNDYKLLAELMIHLLTIR